MPWVTIAQGVVSRGELAAPSLEFQVNGWYWLKRLTGPFDASAFWGVWRRGNYEDAFTPGVAEFAAAQEVELYAPIYQYFRPQSDGTDSFQIYCPQSVAYPEVEWELSVFQF